MPPISIRRLPLISARCKQARRKPGLAAKVHVLLALYAAMLSMALAGCGSSVTSAAKAGPISVAGSSGATQQVSVLATAATLKLSMTPTGDKLNAGVDWTVTCSGNAVTGSQTNGACGTLGPAHTPGGAATVYTAPSTVPINSTITVTATVTSNPSQNSSLTLTIVPLPIAVSISANNGIPASLEINALLTIQDLVTNDSAGAGVIWNATCGSSACGSFNPTVSPSSSSNTIYTAPSVVPTGGAVTISATSLTDTTKSASATLTITPPPTAAGIAVSVSPASVYAQTVGAAHIAHLTAFVGGDAAMAGVDWSISCGASSCGSITTHSASGAAANYSAPSTIPPGGTVTITAKSTTNPAISAIATATIVKAAPIVVTITAAPPSTLTTDSSATLAAKVASDTGNLGVDWTATCGSAGACGSFNLLPAHTASAGQIVYTAPAAVPTGGVVTITASSPATTPANAALAFTTIVAQPPSIAITQAPPATLTAAMQAPVSATVTNDVAPGGVAWMVQCPSTMPGGCGFIAPQQTASGATAMYTAPPVTAPGTSVTLTATSVADPTMTAQSNPIAVVPDTTLAVHFLPSLASQVQTDSTVNLNASVANDASNAGVDWQVCSSGCGFFTTRPAIPAIPATATTPYVPAVPAVTATAVAGWSNGLLIPYTAPSQPPSSGIVAVLAAAHANPTIANSGTIAINANPGGPALNGVVQAGSQPVVGSSVALYAAGTSGYASAASQIAAVTTGKNGSFTVPAGYLCPTSTSQMYLVATGGVVGVNTANPNLTLMTVLGSCGSLGSAPVIVNEVTTVASVFATSPFSANDELTGNKSYLYLGSGSGNLTGLANAFAAVNNLVDISTGQVRFMSPAGQGTVPYVEINTLADMLHACTATSGGVEGDGSKCGTLFTATDVLAANQVAFNAIGPGDTLQAIFNIAQHPVTNGGYQLDPPPQQLLALAVTDSTFQPVLVTQPNDWSLSVNYTGGGGLSTISMVGSLAVDAAGNIWITDTAAGSAIEWNAVGAALSPSAGFPAGGGPIAIDANGNAWISGNGNLNELTSLGTPAPGSPFKGVPSQGSDMAFDAQGDLWIANDAGVSEFNDLGVAVSPAGGFTNNGIVGIGAIGIDSSNNVWVGHQNAQELTSGAYAELTNPGGTLIVDGVVSNAAFGSPVFPELAADSVGDIWGISNGGSVCEVKPYGGNGSRLMPTCYTTDDNTGAGLLTYNPRGAALDGAGTVWIASQGGQGTGPPIDPSVLPVVPSQLGNFFPNFLSSPSLAAGPLRVAIDGSGNVWVLLANNTVTEYVGAATPVVAPIALGVKNKTLAAKP